MQDLGSIFATHMQKIAGSHGERAAQGLARHAARCWTIFRKPPSRGACSMRRPRTMPAMRRSAVILTLDVLRERGNNDIAHEAAGTPPVLIYEHEVAMDGARPAAPVNYVLLKIMPPEGVETFDWKRPYMIIDPRAGHGAGIGGFKPDSQVGVALARRPSGLFRRLPPASRAGPDARRRDARRGGIRRRNPPPPSRCAQADHRRQLPGRLGDPGARRRQSRHYRPAGDQWRAGRHLVGPHRRKSDALQRRPARRRPAGAAAGRSRRRRVRRRASGRRISSSSIPAAIISANITTSSPMSKRRANASSNSSAGGAASTS